MSLKTKKMDGHDNVDVPPEMELFNLKNVSRLYKIVNSVMARTNRYEKARRVLARILNAHKESLPVGSEKMREALIKEPTVDLLNKARDLMLVVAAWEVTPHVPKLSTLGPVYEHGIWIGPARAGWLRGWRTFKGERTCLSLPKMDA